jgi:uroporphyrinogen III methyltransferase/synthase
MGVGRLGEVTARLREDGRDPSEPAAVVERGTLPGQRTVTGTLADVAERAVEAELRAPAVTVLGAVAGLREALAWFERRALHGRSVAITRARAQASGLAGRLADLGADVVEAPVIRIVPRPMEGELATALDRIREYALVCLTSPNGAALLMDALARRGLDARALAGSTVAAIGPGTAAALIARGVRADVVPERSVAEALVEALDQVELHGRRALVARAAAARDLLPDALRERGAEVDLVALYDTVAEPLSEAQIEAITGADYVTFTSSSTVTNLADALAAAGAALNESTRVVSIGPITSATARELGIDVHVEADRHDVEGLVDALVTDSQTRSASRA